MFNSNHNNDGDDEDDADGNNGSGGNNDDVAGSNPGGAGGDRVRCFFIKCRTPRNGRQIAYSATAGDKCSSRTALLCRR
jgi:hypothetical protein